MKCGVKASSFAKFHSSTLVGSIRLKERKRKEAAILGPIFLGPKVLALLLILSLVYSHLLRRLLNFESLEQRNTSFGLAILTTWRLELVPSSY
jgi:hypothetical protein